MASNPGMCPDRELNWRHFGSQASTQSTEPHPLGHQVAFRFARCFISLSLWKEVQFFELFRVQERSFTSAFYILSFLLRPASCVYLLFAHLCGLCRKGSCHTWLRNSQISSRSQGTNTAPTQALFIYEPHHSTTSTLLRLCMVARALCRGVLPDFHVGSRA